MLNSDRIEMIGYQESKNSLRQIKIEGDLIREGKNIYFIPYAKGFATTFSYAKPSRLALERIYQDVQTFDVGGRSTGINIGTMGTVQLFTSMGTSTYVPKMGMAGLVKRKFGPFAQARTIKAILKEMEGQKTYGGVTVKDINLPFQDLGLKLSEQAALIVGRRGAGAILTIEKTPTSYGGRVFGARQTPLETAFQEPAQRVIPIEKVARSVGKQSQSMVSSLIPVKEPSLKGVPRMVGGKGLTEAQMRRYVGQPNFLVEYETLSPRMNIKDVRQANSVSSLLVPMEMSKIDIRQLERQKPLERQRQIEKQILLEKQRLLERQKLLEKQRQLQKQRLLQKQKLQQKQKLTLGFGLIGPTPKLPKGFKPPTKKGQRKSTKEDKKKKKREKKVLPTITQQLMGIRRKTPKSYITGFELVRT